MGVIIVFVGVIIVFFVGVIIVFFVGVIIVFFVGVIIVFFVGVIIVFFVGVIIVFFVGVIIVFFVGVIIVFFVGVIIVFFVGVIILAMVMAPSAKGNGVEQITYLKNVDPVLFGCLDHVDEAFLQAETVGNHQVSGIEQGCLAGRNLVVVRVGARRQQHFDISIPTNDIRYHVTEDRGCRHHRQSACRVCGGWFCYRCCCRRARGGTRCRVLSVRTTRC